MRRSSIRRARRRSVPLAAYARRFSHAEVNSSYYAVPKPPTVAKWVAETPPGFLFDVKLHRIFSMSPAKSAVPEPGKRDLVAATLASVEPLIAANRFGAFLLVLAPFFRPGKRKLTELDGLVERLRPHPLAVELRDRGWVTKAEREKTFAYFRERQITWVAVDMPPLEDDSLLPFLDEVTDPRLAYVRLHGRNPKLSRGEVGRGAAHLPVFSGGAEIARQEHREDRATRAGSARRRK